MKQRGRKSIASLSVVGKPRVIVNNSPDQSPEPPNDLPEPEREIWRTTVSEFRGSLTSYVALHSGLKMHQRAREASERIAEEGLTVETKDGGTRAHPLCAVEREARRSFEMTFRRLGIRL